MTINNQSAVRVAIYARVSSEQQAQEQTIASQVAALRQRVAEDGFELPEELCFLDEGVSGSTLMRPALERLRDAAYVGGFQKLYVHSPDRLARRYAYQVLFEVAPICRTLRVFILAATLSRKGVRHGEETASEQASFVQ